MSVDSHKNFAYSTVATVPVPATTGTSLVVAVGTGSLFPAVPFNVTVWPVGVQPLSSNAEIMRVTAIASDTFTVTRAQEGTSGRTHLANCQIAATITAKVLTDAETFLPGALNVKDAAYGAVGDGITNDTVACQAAFTAAALLTPPPAIVFPQGTYLITGAGPIFSMVDGLRVFGVGLAAITFTGSGALFSVTGKQRCEISCLDITGSFAASTWAIRHVSSGVGAISNHYHHCRIRDFGNAAGTSGAGISIESDSQGLELGPHLFMGNQRANILISAPTDSLWLHDNILTVSTSYTNGPTRAVDASGGAGAGAMMVQNNNCTVEGAGTFRFNGGTWAILDNDVETVQTIVNASNAMIELLAGSFAVRGGNVGGHSATGANYCLFFADGVASSSESDVTYSGYNTAAVRVNTSTGNVFGPSTSSVQATCYSGDAIGIVQRVGQSQVGHSWGYQVPPVTGYGRNGTSFDGPINYTNAETGANNAIVSTSVAVLAVGLRVLIPLNHTLQAGANTLNYNGAGAVAIRSHLNPANNIATAYAAGGFIEVCWDGTRWLDMSQ